MNQKKTQIRFMNKKQEEWEKRRYGMGNEKDIRSAMAGVDDWKVPWRRRVWKGLRD
ncbi:MAG: hypothetical protein ACLTSZ_04610 [Lachnospiraceae bacterium]